ncbi:MAG: pentapeptide repeat-containing protein [Pseudomonadota bacterium]
MRSLVMDKLETIYFPYFYNLIRVLSEEGRQSFVAYYPELVRSALYHTLDKVDYMDDTRTANQINNFITLIINAGFSDFSGLYFKKSKLDFYCGEISYLHHIDFSRANLLNTVFDEFVLKCCFKQANLEGASFKNLVLIYLDFEEANLLNSNFEGSNLTRTNFKKANLTDAKFKSTTLTDVNFEDVSLLNGNFERSNLKSIKFIKVNLESASFQCADLAETKFINSNLENVDFFLAELKEVYFQNTRLVRSNFEKALLYFIDFSKVLLQSANFQDTEILQGADFRYAKLQGANFSNVNLSRSLLTGAALDEATFKGATLTIQQLFKLYNQGIKAFEAIKLVGILYDTSTLQTLEGACLSSQALNHLIRQGFQNFQNNDLHSSLSEVPGNFFIRRLGNNH